MSLDRIAYGNPIDNKLKPENTRGSFDIQCIIFIILYHKIFCRYFKDILQRAKLLAFWPTNDTFLQEKTSKMREEWMTELPPQSGKTFGILFGILSFIYRPEAKVAR